MTEILTTEQLAERLQVSVDAIRRAGLPHHSFGPRTVRYVLSEVLAATRVSAHEDDDTVEEWGQALLQRMTEKRLAGKDGWRDAPIEELELRLLRSIAEGDPVDVGNYAMMIWARGEHTADVLPRHAKDVIEGYYEDAFVVGARTMEIERLARQLVRAWRDEDGKLGPVLDKLAKEIDG